jgi:phosphatidylserine/phosphatidylglycerophosphate/cardiolipin synthase-like enzyme
VEQKITFLEGKHTLDVVREILEVEKREIALAVAFWGDSAIEKIRADEWTAKKVSIVCNATSGCCNPSVLESLRKKFNKSPSVVKSNPKLHAKVYWTPSKMVITSANASSSGLSIPGALEGNVEAGVVVESKTLIDSVKEWFDKLVLNPQTVDLDEGVPKSLDYVVKPFGEGD